MSKKPWKKFRNLVFSISSIGVFLAGGSAIAKNSETLLASNTSRQNETQSGKRVIEPVDAVVRGSSEYNREGKKGYVAYELIGFTPLGSSGLMGGAFLDQDTIVDAALTSGKFEWLGFEIESTTFAVRYKKFNGNSFYWRAGGMIRTFEYNAVYSPISSDTSSQAITKVSSIGADFGIGNQWQWETFTMGCDWIGFFVPLTGSYRISRPSNSTESWYQSEKKDADNLAKRGNSQLLRFYLGAAF